MSIERDEDTSARKPARRRRAVQKPSTEPTFNEDELRADIANIRYHQLFDLRGRTPDYRNILERARNPQVEDVKAWEECEPIVADILAHAPKPQIFDPAVTRALFVAERQRFTKVVKDPKGFRTVEILSDYRIARSRALRPISDDIEFKRYEILAEMLFQQGFFRNF